MGLINCTQTRKPTSQVAPLPANPANDASGERGSYTLKMEPNETKSITRTFTGFIFASGIPIKSIRLKFIDITDSTNPKILRSEVISAGAQFKIRNNFTGTKTIKTEITNLANTENTVNLTLQIEG